MTCKHYFVGEADDVVHCDLCGAFADGPSGGVYAASIMTSEQRVREQYPNAECMKYGIYRWRPDNTGVWIGKDWDHAASRLPQPKIAGAND